MKNKPRTLQQFIEYRNMLIKRRDSRLKHGLLPLNKDDYYTIRLIELDQQFPQFKGIGRIKLK